MLNGWAEIDGALNDGVVLVGAEPPPPQPATVAKIKRGISLSQTIGQFIFRISVLDVGLNNSKKKLTIYQSMRIQPVLVLPRGAAGLAAVLK